MSTLKLSSNASGTGEFTIASPNSNTNRTFNLPDSSGTIATTESTLAQFNASGSAPVYAARAWVNFNGTGTVAIRASGNVSSITDNGVGSYAVNLASAMPDQNGAISAGCAGQIGSVGSSNPTVASAFSANNIVQLRSINPTANTLFDSDGIYCSVFR